MTSVFDPHIESLKLPVKSRQELADEYGICTNTFKIKIKRAGIILPAGAIFPSTQKEIYSRLGLPVGLKQYDTKTL